MYELKKQEAKILVAALAGLKSTLSKDQMTKLKELYEERCETCSQKIMMHHGMMKAHMGNKTSEMKSKMASEGSAEAEE